MYARTTTLVRDGTDLNAQAVTELKQGQAAEVLERGDRHYRVSAGGKTGWVYYNKLTDKRPEDVASALAGSPETQGITLAELKTGGAMRGLSPTGQDYAQAANIPQWARDAVDGMRARNVTAKELDAFARAGPLGEYSEGQ
jgi:hypothetical protein